MISDELRRMIGQMLICGFPSPRVDDQARKILDEFYVGNFYYFSRNIQSAAQCAALAAELSAMTYDKLGISPIIATDQEGGIVSRLVEGAALTPGAAAVGAAILGMRKSLEKKYKKPQDKARELPLFQVRTMARNTGEILRACGISMTAAPDMDVNIEPANPIIGTRSYGDDPDNVAEAAITQMKGLAEGGVIAMIKHFPGHGNVKSDSHLGIPVNDTDRQKLMDTEFKTFREAIREGAEALMTAHVRYTGVDPENPATLSKIIMTDLTRKEFGFEGVIGTDCLEMDAIRAAYGCGEGAVRAIEAGVDLLTISHTYTAVSQAAQGIYEAVESGRISEQRIRESYERIMKLKAKYGLMESQSIDPEKAETMVNSQGRQFVCEDLMNEAITLLQGDFDLNLQKGGYLTVACDQTPATGAEDMKQLSFAHMMGEKFGCPAMALHLNPEPEEVSRAVASIREQLPAMRPETDDPVPLILGLYNARFREGQKAIIEEILKMKQEGLIRLYVFLLGAPYDLPLVKDADCVITTYEYTRLSLAALLKAMEEHRFPGVSPFKL